MVEHMLSMQEVLGSIPSTQKSKSQQQSYIQELISDNVLSLRW